MSYVLAGYGNTDELRGDGRMCWQEGVIDLKTLMVIVIITVSRFRDHIRHRRFVLRPLTSFASTAAQPLVPHISVVPDYP